MKAAQAVWGRFVELTAGALDAAAPVRCSSLDAPASRAGLSARKVEYLSRPGAALRRRARAIRSRWREMDDEAIIEELVAIRGIGRWTAEMFLIFHLMRPNVLPLDDLGLIKGISLNYFSGRAGKCRAPKIARGGRRPGRRIARSPLGTFGAASIPCRSNIECNE